MNMNCLLAATSGGFWMPQRASTVAPEVDGLFNFIMWVTIFFFFLILALTVVFVIKYRYREGAAPPEKTAAHSTALELTWTVIPTIIVLMIFYFGFRGYLHMEVAPPDAYEINVNGKTWNWEFTYPNQHVDSELHIPVKTPIRVVLSSQDVIHSLFIPQFRVKKDAVPGRYNRFWFEATETTPLGPDGKPDPNQAFDIYCAEYCGQSHSDMRAKVIVHTPEDYRRWLEDASNWQKSMTPLEAGKMFVNTRGCLTCHSVDGSRSTGPTWKDLFGRDEPMSDGTTVHVDENYIRESLYEPAAKVVAGYTVQMQSYKGSLKEEDVGAIIAYMKSISSHYKGDQLPAAAGATQPTTAPATK